MKQLLTRAAGWALMLTLLLTLASCGVKPEDDRIIASADGIEFTYDEFRYFFMNSKEELDGGDDSVWAGNEELKKQLQESVLYRLKRVTAIHQLAEEYEIELTGEDEDIIEEYIDTMIDGYGSEEAYRAELEQGYLTEYALRQTLRTQYLLELVQAHVIDERNFLIRADDEALYADLETKFWRGAQILIRNEEGEDPEANRRLAEEALEKLKGGESFFKLVAQYGEDPGMQGNDDGYYFTEGQLLAYFEEEVRGLEIGQYTEVVECVHGYAIITRLEMEEDYIKEHIEDLRDAMKIRLFNEFLEETIADTQVATTTLFYQFNVDNME